MAQEMSKSKQSLIGYAILTMIATPIAVILFLQQF